MTYNLWGMWSSKLGHHTGLYVRPQDVDDVELGRYAVVRHRLSVNDSREQKEFLWMRCVLGNSSLLKPEIDQPLALRLLTCGYHVLVACMLVVAWKLDLRAHLVYRLLERQIPRRQSQVDHPPPSFLKRSADLGFLVLRRLGIVSLFRFLLLGIIHLMYFSYLCLLIWKLFITTYCCGLHLFLY